MRVPLKNRSGRLPVAAVGRHAKPTGLAEHLGQCARARGRAHALREVTEAAHAALLPRFVSTVTALVALVLGIAWLAG